MTLLEFLQSRLTEDKLTALAAIEGSPAWHSSLAFRDVKDEHGHFVVEADRHHPSVEQAAHIARHCPARALADVEVKRLMIADYLRSDAAAELLARGALENAFGACPPSTPTTPTTTPPGHSRGTRPLTIPVRRQTGSPRRSNGTQAGWKRGSRSPMCQRCLPSPRLKMAVVTFLVTYALTAIIVARETTWLPRSGSFYLVNVITNVLLVSLLTCVTMPVAARAFRSWLY